MSTPEIPARFESREALVRTLRATFPRSAGDPSPTRGGRSVALEVLNRIDPRRYGSTRNQLDGAVTRLSPYLRHGAITLGQVRDAALDRATPDAAEKLLSELGWREYFRRVLGEIGSKVWQDLEPPKTGRPASGHQPELPKDVANARTGLACMDGFLSELFDTGYLHNHARMWFASYLVHHRRVRWQAGARLFLEHLLDGDVASNNLSWQWVASTFSHKPYIFNRENLERYTSGRFCRECPARTRCPFDGSYESLTERLFSNAPVDDMPSPVGAIFAGPDKPSGSLFESAEPSVADDGSGVVWLHDETLDPTGPLLRGGRPAVFVYDRAVIDRERWSLKRLVFVHECLAEIEGLTVLVSDDPAAMVVAFARSRGARRVITTDSFDPNLRELMDQVEQKIPLIRCEIPTLARLDRAVDLRRFSRFWAKVQRQVMRRPGPTTRS